MSLAMSRRDLRILAVGSKKPITLTYTDKELSITDGWWFMNAFGTLSNLRNRPRYSGSSTAGHWCAAQWPFPRSLICREEEKNRSHVFDDISWNRGGRRGRCSRCMDIHSFASGVRRYVQFSDRYCIYPSTNYLGVGVKRGRRLKVVINPHGGAVCHFALFYILLSHLSFRKKVWLFLTRP